MHKILLACSICYKAKSQFHQGLCTLLPVPLMPWNGVSMDFIIAIPMTERGRDAIMVVVDRYLKMARFVLCHKTDYVSYVTKIYFKEIIRVHSVPKTIISDQDSKFLRHNWSSCWKLLGTKLSFSTSYHPQIDSQIEITNQTLISFFLVVWIVKC